MPAFVPGTELSQRFFGEVIRPILEAHYPALPYAAAHIGPGSDVLGFDTEMSTDHDWGPRAHLFLRDEDAALAAPLRELFRHTLPHTFAGYPVGFAPSPGEDGVGYMQEQDAGPIDHRIFVETLKTFIQYELGWTYNQPLDAADWLSFPAQKLREITAGAVFEDGIGDLNALRQRLAWYPHDVWLYLLAAGWTRIGQENHLMPRAGFVGDELGSALIGSRLVRDIMNQCFLMERQYAPYPKWFGSGFKQLACAEQFTPVLWRAQLAPTWQEREAAVGEAYLQLASLHNALGVTEALPVQLTDFHERPFMVIDSDAFVEALRAAITDPDVKAIADRRPIGNIDQWSDNTDLRDTVWWPKIRSFYT